MSADATTASLYRREVWSRETWPALTLPELLSMQMQAREPLLLRGDAPILRRKDQVLGYAPRGAGKTFTFLGLAVALSHGRPIGPWTPTRAVRCLYVDGEMPGGDLQSRAKRLLGSDDPSPRLTLLVADCCAEPVPSLASEAGQELIEMRLAETGSEVLFLDHLSALFGALAENDAEAWAPCAAWLLALRRRGYTVVLIHHAGKSGTQRGSSKREDNADLILSFKLPENYMPEDGLRIEVHHEKVRGIVGAAAEPFELRLVGDTSDPVVGFAWGELAADKKAEALEMLSAGRPVKAVAKDLDVHVATVYRWKKGTRAFA